MPLIQWIMQNLQKKIPVGVKTGGEAELSTVYNLLSSGGVELSGESINILVPGFEGVIVGGQATARKLSNLFGLGGVQISGTALIQTGFVNRKRVDFAIGDTVVFCRQKYVITGIRIATEPIYFCKNYNGIFKFYQSQLTSCPVINYESIISQLECLGGSVGQIPEPPVIPVVEYVYKVPVTNPDCTKKGKITLERILKNLKKLGVET